jgi:biotin carboxyl carrier protein
MQARQRAEEVTALKAALDDLRLRQYKQTHPEATEQRVNALLLGNEPQQQQKQQQQPQQQQQPKQQSASSGRDAPAAPPAPAAAAAANTNTSRVWGEQHEGRKQIRIFIGVYVSPNMAPVESSIFAILVTITSRLDDHG